LQGFLLQVEISEIIVHEADEPNAFVDFLDAEFLAGHHSGDVDPLAMKAESPACGDDDVAIVEWIGELWQAIDGGSQLRIDFEQRQGRSR
jgi:hypothetical protein